MKHYNTNIIVQARLGSTRLPSKVLFPLKRDSVLAHVLHHCVNALGKERVIVATTTQPEDIAIETYCQYHNIACVRGSSENVLERYVKANQAYPSDHIIRICADSPIIDSHLIQTMLEYYQQHPLDYCSNTLTDKYPEGESVEIFSAKALETAFHQASLPSEKEHVTPFIKNHPDLFNIAYFNPIEHLSHHRFTIDYLEDYLFFVALFEHTTQSFLTLKEACSILGQFSSIQEINHGINRNIGYKKSLNEDHYAIQ